MPGNSRENAAWRLIFGTPAKHQTSYKPRNLPNAPRNIVLDQEAVAPAWTSPYSNKPLFVNNTRKTANNKRYSTVVVNSRQPLTTNQHNQLINKIRAVTSV